LKVKLLRNYILKIPDVCLNIILEYSHCFEGKIIKKFGDEKPIERIEELPNGQIMTLGKVSPIDDNYESNPELQIWNPISGICILTVPLYYERLINYLILQNGNIIIIEREITIYDTLTGKILFQEPNIHGQNIFLQSELHDGRIIVALRDASYSSTREYGIWDININEITRIHQGSKFYISLKVPILSNGKFVLLEITDGLKFYLFNPDNSLETIICHPDEKIKINNIRITTIGNKLLLTSRFNVLTTCLYDLLFTIIDFETYTIRSFSLNLDLISIESIEVLSLNKILITQTCFNYNTFSILNLDTEEIYTNTYSPYPESESSMIGYDNHFIGVISNDQIALFHSSSDTDDGHIKIFNLNSESKTPKLHFDLEIHTYASYGTVLSNKTIIAGTKNYTEIAIYK